MEQIWKLRKLLFSVPAVCVYGNELDFSRYKLLKSLTDFFAGKESIINKCIKGKRNIAIYPDTVGNYIFAVQEEDIMIIKSVDEVMDTDADWIYVPGKSGGDVILFPNGNDDEKFLNIKEIIFVESFPFGKKDFCDYVMTCIENREISCCKKVLLIDDNLKYGATDISDEYLGIENVCSKLEPFVDGINLFSKDNWNDISIDVKKQYFGKKKVILDKCRRDFEYFDREYDYMKQRFLCDEERKGILTDTALEIISSYKNVKGSGDVESRILNNLMEYIEKNKDDIKRMIANLYDRYLLELKMIQNEEISFCYDEFAKHVRKEYKKKTKVSCPDSKLDYRILCSNNRYVVGFKNHLENMTEKYLKNAIHMSIERDLEACEVKYYEKIEA